MLLCVCPECHQHIWLPLAGMPGSCKPQKPGALTVRIIFSSRTAFACLKTNRSIREMGGLEKINCHKRSVCYQVFYPLLEAQLVSAPHSSLSLTSLMATATFGEKESHKSTCLCPCTCCSCSGEGKPSKLSFLEQ